MSEASRLLNIGDYVSTDYNWNNGKLTIVMITDVDRTREHGQSQSGVMFRVWPLLKYGTEHSWYCADWFEPITLPPSDCAHVFDVISCDGERDIMECRKCRHWQTVRCSYDL